LSSFFVPAKWKASTISSTGFRPRQKAAPYLFQISPPPFPAQFLLLLIPGDKALIFFFPGLRGTTLGVFYLLPLLARQPFSAFSRGLKDFHLASSSFFSLKLNLIRHLPNCQLLVFIGPISPPPPDGFSTLLFFPFYFLSPAPRLFLSGPPTALLVMWSPIGWLYASIPIGGPPLTLTAPSNFYRAALAPAPFVLSRASLTCFFPPRPMRFPFSHLCPFVKPAQFGPLLVIAIPTKRFSSFRR